MKTASIISSGFNFMLPAQYSSLPTPHTGIQKYLARSAKAVPALSLLLEYQRLDHRLNHKWCRHIFSF
jgi:hypothetical protein